MSSSQRSFYDILGVAEDADTATIRRAFRKAAARCHPDRHRDKGAEELARVEAEYKELSNAHDVLTDDAKRRKYDEMRRNPHAYAPRGHAAGAGPVYMTPEELFARMFGFQGVAMPPGTRMYAGPGGFTFATGPGAAHFGQAFGQAQMRRQQRQQQQQQQQPQQRHTIIYLIFFALYALSQVLARPPTATEFALYKPSGAFTEAYKIPVRNTLVDYYTIPGSFEGRRGAAIRRTTNAAVAAKAEHLMAGECFRNLSSFRYNLSAARRSTAREDRVKFLNAAIKVDFAACKNYGSDELPGVLKLRNNAQDSIEEPERLTHGATLTH